MIDLNPLHWLPSYREEERRSKNFEARMQADEQCFKSHSYSAVDLHQCLEAAKREHPLSIEVLHDTRT